MINNQSPRKGAAPEAVSVPKPGVPAPADALKDRLQLLEALVAQQQGELEKLRAVSERLRQEYAELRRAGGRRG